MKKFSSNVDVRRLLAEDGNPIAQISLGFDYANGNGVPQDYAEAVKWYRMAADQGYAEAQLNMGVMYYNGQGVPQNYSEAYVWLSLAAAGGQENAIKNRDMAAEKLSPAELAAARFRAYMLSGEAPSVAAVEQVLSKLRAD